MTHIPRWLLVVGAILLVLGLSDWRGDPGTHGYRGPLDSWGVPTQD